VAALSLLTIGGYQLFRGRQLVESTGFFSAHVPWTVAIYGLFMAGLTALAFLLPARWVRFLPVLSGTGALVIVAMAAIRSAQMWSIVTAGATLGAAWLVGDTLLRRTRLRTARLADTPLVGLALGYSAVAIAVFLVGMAGLLRWWTVGIGTLVVAVAAAVVAARRLRANWPPAVQLGRVEALLLSFVGLCAAYAAIWTSAPEVQYDAVYAHTWISEGWATAGRIRFSTIHPVVNMFGSGYVFPIPTHLLGAHESERWLQYGLALVIALGIWRLARPYGSTFAALAAVAFLITPHVVWQMSTAYDDLALTLLVAGLAAAILRAEDATSPGSASFVVGLLAGGAFAGKLHLAPFAVSALAAWAAFTAERTRLRRLVIGACGAAVVALPYAIGRWIALSNPFFPQFNNIFRSPYFAPVNARFNLPYLHTSGLTELFRFPFDATVEPTRYMEAVPPGAFGVLIAGLLLGIAAGFLGGRRAVMASCALVVAMVGWWTQLRYLRYLLPYAAVGLLLLANVLGPAVQRGARRVLWLWPAAISVLMLATFPSTLSAFWMISGRLPVSVALGSESRRAYESRTLPMSDLSDAINRFAAPGSLTVGDRAYVRSGLSDGRDSSPDWEFGERLLLHFPAPATSVDEAYERWTSLGVSMLAVDTARRLTGRYPADELDLLASRADLVWASRGSELYRLTTAPAANVPIGLCSVDFVDADPCWGAALDGEPGVTQLEAPNGVRQTIRVCPEATYLVDVSTSSTSPGASTIVTTIAYDASGQLVGYQRFELIDGMDSAIALTAPATADQITFSLQPGPGATVDTATIERAAATPCGRN